MVPLLIAAVFLQNIWILFILLLPLSLSMHAEIKSLLVLGGTAMFTKNISKIPRAVWVQLFLLALGYAVYSANRLSFGVGLKAIAGQLALTTVEIGTIGTIFTLGQAFIDVPAGFLADQFGRKRMLVMGMTGLGFMTAMREHPFCCGLV